jgi:uncharacterized pyridoxamine 5'-phosphate oxidase family protein
MRMRDCRLGYLFLTFLFYALFSCESNSEKEYFDDGILRSEYNFSNGKKHGVGKEYYPDGQLKSETNWNNGIEIGVNKFYFENGNLKLIKEIKSNSKVQITKFHKDGSKQLVSKWLNNMKHGYTAFYDEDIVPYERKWYHNGEQVFLELRDSVSMIGFLTPEIVLSKDTVAFDESINVKISFWHRLIGLRKLYSVKMNKDYSIIDTTSIGFFNQLNVGEIDVRPFKKGVNNFYILYNQTENVNDTFPSANNLVSQFKVVVH